MKILDKKVLAEREPRIVYLEVLAEEICKAFKPGQFVILMVSEVGERIPLTIVDKNLKNQMRLKPKLSSYHASPYIVIAGISSWICHILQITCYGKIIRYVNSII